MAELAEAISSELGAADERGKVALWYARGALRLDDAANNPQRCWELWDLLLYAWMTFVVVSGVLASEVALVLVSPSWEHDRFWSWAHHESSELLMPLIGIHLGLHLRWIVNALRGRGGQS